MEREEYYNSITSVSVTIPEGFDIDQVGATFSAKLKNFNESKFLSVTQGKEGYLFPDTYFFLNNANETDVIKSMSENFDKKITPLNSAIKASGKSEKEIITMASIIEHEAEGNSDRQVIAGILWKRISLGIPLEVDSAPTTYQTKGLPASPICNPGMQSILAALYPQSSPYLYYLHDKEGNVHYASTFEEHKVNKQKYLNIK